MFPTGYAILDPFTGATVNTSLGAPNWTGPVLGDGVMPVKDGDGRGLRSTANGTPASAAWARQMASIRSAFVTMAVLPTGAGNICAVGGLRPLDGGGAVIFAQFDVDTHSIFLNSGLANRDDVIAGPAAGDSFGMTYDPDTDVAASWYRRGSAAWAQLGTIQAGYRGANYESGTGLYAYLETDDIVVRLTNFGGEILPGSSPAASLTAPLVHGRGAC